MDPSLDIFGLTHRYLDGAVALDDVQEWLVPRLGIFLVDPHATASELAGLLELGFADIAAGEADEGELRELVSAFLRENESIQLASEQWTAATNVTVSIEGLFVGSPEAAFSQSEPMLVGI